MAGCPAHKLTAVEGHVVAGHVQRLPAAGGAAGRSPGVSIGAGAGLHFFLQDQPANPALELRGEGKERLAGNERKGKAGSGRVSDSAA